VPAAFYTTHDLPVELKPLGNLSGGSSGLVSRPWEITLGCRALSYTGTVIVIAPFKLKLEVGDIIIIIILRMWIPDPSPVLCSMVIQGLQ
jgi:hypothetical protein